MPTAIMTLPGTLASVPPGMEEAILLEPSGFVSRGLESLYLYEEASGTALEDAKGSADGVIDSIASSNNAFARLSGGGIRLSGAQLGSFPAFDASGAWTLITGQRIVGQVTATGTEKIVGLVGIRDFYSTVRGVNLHSRGATNLTANHTNAKYVHRPANGSGAAGTAEDLTPININTYNLPRLAMLSYNGTTLVESRVLDGTGAVIASDSMTVTAAQLWTISGTTLSTRQWSIGGGTSVYGHGVVEHEFSARYSRPLSDFSAAELTLIAEAAAALGADRGRAW